MSKNKKNKQKGKQSQQKTEQQGAQKSAIESAEKPAAEALAASEQPAPPKVQTPASPKRKFCDEIGRKKKLTERDIGYTDFEWPFVVAGFKGEVLKPAKLTPFDKAVCDLLLMKNFGWVELGQILGLDIGSDPAERTLLINEIKALYDIGMIEGDDSILWLTETGREFARKGEKIETYEEDFELYIDPVFGFNDTGKKIFSALKSEEFKEADDERFYIDFLDSEASEEEILDAEEESPDTETSEVKFLDEKALESVKLLAAAQAPEAHCPEKRYKLAKCRPTAKKCFSAKLKVVLLENFRDETNRVLVYDEKSEKVIEPLSEAFSENEEQMKRIFEKILAESAESESPLESTDEEKSDEQIEYEQAQIEKQEELDQAIDSGDQSQLEKIVNQELENRNSSEKRLFYTLEFEAEFERLLTGPYDEIMILTPWIKNATLKRISLYESFLKRGKKLFIAYSAPERPDDIMCYEKPFSELQKLEAKYPQFYLCQREQPFHFKQVWCKGFFLYNGSENISSFMPKGSDEVKVRDECMTKLSWASDLENDYSGKLASFALRYLAEAEQKFDELCRHENISLDRNFLKEVAAFKIDKLEFFVDKTIEEFDAEYDRWRSFKENKTADFRKKFCEQEILKIQADLEAEAQKSVNQVVSIKKLNELEKRLGAFCKEFPESETLAQKSSLQDLLSEYRERFYKNQVEQLLKAVDVPKDEVISPERLKGYEKSLKEIVEAFPKAGSWAEKSKVEKLLAELLERFYRNEFSKINEEIRNISDADFRKKDLANFKNRLKKLSEEFPALDDWLQKAGTENLLEGKYERAYKLLISELLKEVKKLGEGSFEKKQLTEFQSRLKNICSEFPEAEALPKKSEIECLLKELLIRSYRNKLLNFRKEIEPEQGEVLTPSKIKDFRNRLNALAKEIPAELVGETAEIATRLDDLLLNYYKHKITVLAKDIEAKRDALVPPAEFREFQNRLDEVLKNCKKAEDWDETRNIKASIENFRERHYRSVLSKILEEIKSLGGEVKNRAKEFRKRKENILRDFPEARNWQETTEIDELLKPKNSVQ